MEMTTAYKKLCKMTGYIKIVQGSAGAGKTYSILMRWILMALRSEEHQECAIYAQTVGHLRKGAVKDFQDICRVLGLSVRMYKAPFRCTVGRWDFIFLSVDHELKGVGIRRDRLFINEAIAINYDYIEPLVTRTHREVIMDFNAKFKFWAHTKYLPMKTSSFLTLTFHDNELQPFRERENLLYWAPGSPGYDANRWAVFGLGEIGQLEGRILKYKTYDSLPSGLSSSSCMGVDFGWVDPSAVVKVYYDHDHRKVYWREVFYGSGATTEVMAEGIRKSGLYDDDILVADHDPRQTNALRRLGFTVVRARKKERLSRDVVFLNQYELFVHVDSHRLRDEVDRWVYQKHVINGEDVFIGEPLQTCSDHLIDAGRYGTKQIVRSYG